MKRIFCILLLTFILIPFNAMGSDRAIFLNAFGETATAYLHASFLALGTTADGFVADIIPKENALEYTKNVQKGVRVIRAKIKAVSAARIADVDKKVLGLLDSAYGCLDHLSWALTQYVEDKNPETAKKFADQRTECLERLTVIKDFYSRLPPSPEVAEPLSTR
jgi:hypothetical protein